ncbi:hypothetical protein B0T22DRAFT_490571 [Podospora appendiculata]|uniref:Uncharacterized protein n=1 Tax=Podospora appendiculata TaxID=314037 RepID=A0AAE1CCZ0_9PEZI|nr:hypothetical protein B0T22DRAFT_490571 [Podospora appendiculata]
MASPDEAAHAPNMVTGDSGPGTALRDFLPIPPAQDPTDHEGLGENGTAGGLPQGSTLSHALANDGQDVKGRAQQDHAEDEVLDLGWNEEKKDIAAPLVGGMDNEELWLLVRRFNKQIYHLKATPYQVPGGLDLNIADQEEFSPDKMRTTLERLYMTIGIGILGAVKHIARLRSWREQRRTAYFAAAYFVAWAFDFIVPMISAMLIALIAYPPSRDLLFPPVPVSLIDSNTGGVQKPRSGQLGSDDSATGAPENHKGEAVEQEAANFMNGIASVAMGSASAEAKKATDESKLGPEKHDKTKEPMETAIFQKMTPVMHTLGDLADNWERFANALSPTPPFPRETHRLRLATLVIPIFGISLFITSYMFMKGLTFTLGFSFFGDPIIRPGLAWLNRTFPNWQKLLEVRNTILKGVPTNAQLTITLLRIGEANKAPLPPPPRIDSLPPSQSAAQIESHIRSTGAGTALDASTSELNSAMRYNEHEAHEDAGPDVSPEEAKVSKHGRKGSKLINFFKGTTKGAVHAAIGTDHVRAAVGSQHAKHRLGAVPAANEVPISGPVEFKARFDGKKGHVYLSTAATVPVVAFGVKESAVKVAGTEREDLHPLWSVAVADISEVKKVGGYGWKAKLVVGWSLEREVSDGLEIRTVNGEMYKITAVPLRDELFNRLVAMGGQKWEAW